MGIIDKEFAAWKKEHGESGKLAMNRFIMSKFIAALEEVAPGKYIFKGGNLLWHYINTPRPTIDIDFSTDIDLETEEIANDIRAIAVPEVVFTVLRAEKKEREDKIGIALRVKFETTSGASNSFGIDIVLAIPTHKARVKILNREVTAASIENILVDKVSACIRFGGGNTRMKDFDDLYRIAIQKPKVRPDVLRVLSEERGVPMELDKRWVRSGMIENWSSYLSQKEYKGAKDLPKDLLEVIEIINVYLRGLIKM